LIAIVSGAYQGADLVAYGGQERIGSTELIGADVAGEELRPEDPRWSVAGQLATFAPPNAGLAMGIAKVCVGPPYSAAVRREDQGISYHTGAVGVQVPAAVVDQTASETGAVPAEAVCDDGIS